MLGYKVQCHVMQSCVLLCNAVYVMRPFFSNSEINCHRIYSVSAPKTRGEAPCVQKQHPLLHSCTVADESLSFGFDVCFQGFSCARKQWEGSLGSHQKVY